MSAIEERMKPIIILPPGAMTKEDVQELRNNGLCVVEAKEPSLVKFVDTIPAIIGRTHVEHAAIQLSRKVLNPSYWSNGEVPNHIATNFLKVLTAGTPLDPNQTKQEREQEVFDIAKAEELRRLGREEAKAERAAMKAAAKSPAK